SRLCLSPVFFFFFQAEDGIRDLIVTGVQTCALPISAPPSQTRYTAVPVALIGLLEGWPAGVLAAALPAVYRVWLGGAGAPAGVQIGRASCRERVWRRGVGVAVEGDSERGWAEGGVVW